MTGVSQTLYDSSTMLGRNLKHIVRYPGLTGMLLMMPIIFLLLFVYVFGSTLGSGLGGSTDGRAAYVNYVVPGIILMTIAGAAQGTAISVAMDRTEGIFARFRTMAISRASVLTGHVLGSIIQMFMCVVVVTAVAVLVGFRPEAGIASWILVVGFVALIGFALTWLTVAVGLAARSVETASNLPMPLMLLPMLGSGFVPTDSMPTVLRWFADYQPFTPITETLRGLLMGTPVGGGTAIVALAWCAGIALGGYLWGRRLYNRESA